MKLTMVIFDGFTSIDAIGGYEVLARIPGMETEWVAPRTGVVAADTDAAAARLATSLQQSFVALRRGHPTLLPPPVDSMDGRWTPHERAGVEHAFSEAVIGSPATVHAGIEAFLARTRVDELMVTAAIYDHAARLRSFEIVAEVAGLGASTHASS